MNSIKFASLFYFIFFINYLALSQVTVSGTLKDSNGIPIENATITLEPTYQISTSKNNGEFIFNNIAPAKYKIFINLIGYTTIEDFIEVNATNLKLSYTLEPDLLNLQTVVVTGTFDPRKTLVSSTSVSTLNSKDIQTVVPRGTANLLQDIPGTFVDASAGEVFTRVYTRGISASAEDDMGWYYVSLQEDGLPVSIVQHSYYAPDLFHRVDLTTKNIEAVRGGSSSITTLNAPGGIYNFISRGIQQEFGGEIQVSKGFQGNNNSIERLDGVLSGPLGSDWYFNIGGHYRRDDGARDMDFEFSKGGQLKFNLIKKTDKGSFKFYGKFLNDFTNRYTGVAATNWDNPTPAFGQDFRTTSLLMPSFNGNIPDGRNLNTTNSFNPSNGVYAKDLAFGLDFKQDLGNQLTLKNNFKFSTKSANWQTSISNAFVSLNNPLAYFISGADFPIGQVIFKDIQNGNEIARLDNSGILAGQPIQYLSDGRLPNDAIMGTSAWYKDIIADEWMNQFTLQKKWENHDFSTGFAAAYSNTSHFTQGSFAFATYEPNPRMLEVTLENPTQPIISLSDENGLSNYGGLFFVNSEAKVTQIATFVNDRWKIGDKIHLDLGVRFENIAHNGSKDRFAPASSSGGLDGNNNTAYDNGILAPTGEKDNFKFNYTYLSYSAGVNYKFNPNIASFARFSNGNKAPELNYYFNNFSNVPINGKGEIQKIIQAELGVKFKSKYVSFTGTAFWSELKNIGTSNFEFDSDTNSVFYTPILFNTSRTIGFEWESVFTPINHLALKFNGVLQNPKAEKWQVYDAARTVDTSDDSIQDFSGNTLAFNPKILFNLSAIYQKNKFSSFLKWKYLGKREGNVSNGFQLNAYSIFDAGVDYKINKKWSVNVLVTNLFNSEGLANFFGPNSFGANANNATPEFVQSNPDASFVVVPVLQRGSLLKLNYIF